MKVTQKNLLKSGLVISPRHALWITKLCNGTSDPANTDWGRARINECYHRPSETNLILTVINKLIGGYGVEGVEYEENAIRDGDFISYVNMGDTYKTTILWNPEIGKFEIGCWGDVYENSPAYQAHQEQEGA